MANIWITNGNRKNGEVLDMNASIEGTGYICAEARKTSHGWIIEPRSEDHSDLIDSAGDASEAYSKLRKVALHIANSEAA